MLRKKTFDIVVAGSGLAGLATAFFLAERGVSRLAVTDREPGPGLAASSRSASMICQLVRDPLTCRLMIRSTRLLKDMWLKLHPETGFIPCGSLHIGTRADLAAFDASVAAARAEGVEVVRLERTEAVRRFKALGAAEFEEALWCPSDGIVDTAFLVKKLWQDLQKRGVRFGFAAPGTVRESDGGFEAQAGSDSWLCAPVLVNAAGAWAGAVAQMAGAAALPVEPMRRHVFVTAAVEPKPEFPIIWDVTHEIYVRPDGAAVMTSPCDEESHPAGPSGVSESAQLLLEKKLKSFFPSILGVRHTKIWSGLRTFSKDRKFVIGWDAQRDNFFWTACLGGYGVTAAAGCGELAAALLTRADADPDFKKAFSPARFAGVLA